MEEKVVKKNLFFTIGKSTVPAPAAQLRHFCTTKGTQIGCHRGLVVLFGAVEGSKVVGGVEGGLTSLVGSTLIICLPLVYSPPWLYRAVEKAGFPPPATQHAIYKL